MKILDREIKAVIFDIDGTLLDSTSIWGDIDIEFFKKRNMELPSDYSKAIGHIGLDKAAEYTINRFHLNEKKEDIIAEWKQGVLDHYKNKVNLKPGVYEFVHYLKDNGIKFCAATANDEDCYRSALEKHGIFDLFDFVAEVGNYSHGKESPEIYLSCVKRLGVTPQECAIFEDLLVALESGKKAGFLVCGVYDIYCKQEKEKETFSDIYLKSMDEIFKYIK